MRLAAPLARACELTDECSMGNFCIGMRELHHIFDLIYDPRDPVECSNAQKLMRKLTAESAAMGYGEYRTRTYPRLLSPPRRMLTIGRVDLFLMDQVASTYGDENQIQLRFQECLKDALDPQGIIAPGKSGIWPKRLRQYPGIRLGVSPEQAPKTDFWPSTSAPRM